MKGLWLKLHYLPLWTLYLLLSSPLEIPQRLININISQRVLISVGLWWSLRYYSRRRQDLWGRMGWVTSLLGAVCICHGGLQLLSYPLSLCWYLLHVFLSWFPFSVRRFFGMIDLRTDILSFAYRYLHISNLTKDASKYCNYFLSIENIDILLNSPK